MNYAIILAGGVGQRMRNSGMPKQFLEVFRKPIIIYTLERFEDCLDIDKIVIVCNSSWIDYMHNLLKKFSIQKVTGVVAGGKDRQGSVENGIAFIEGATDEDIVVIHDGVRPLIQKNIISENVRVAKKYGSAMTVRPVIESVVITNEDSAKFDDFKKRSDTYSLTAPQTFRLDLLKKAFFTEQNKAFSPPPNVSCYHSAKRELTWKSNTFSQRKNQGQTGWEPS